MPWNNQNSGGGGGGWKSGGGGGGGGPWGQGGGGGGGNNNQPPDLEDILKRGQDRLKQVMPGSGLPGPLIAGLGLLAAAVGCFYAFTFQVKPDEQGVVLRFGQYVRSEPPGLHLRWPYPVEEVRLPRVLQQRITEIGSRSVGRSTTVRDHPEESLMLTGDENIVDTNFTVYWRIKPDRDSKTGRFGVEQYLFNIEEPQNTVKEVAESVMREVVGQSELQPILTEARQKIEQRVQKLIQEVLDLYGAGIRVDQVQLQKVDPPAEVIESFRNVQAARQDRDRLQNEAQTYANQKVPEARGSAERILLEAEGYKQQTVAEAIGQSSRFTNVYEEYKKAPEVTRRRMFLETMERVLGGADKIILDNKGGPGVVPYLPLEQLQQKK